VEERVTLSRSSMSILSLELWISEGLAYELGGVAMSYRLH
jgi:hypothetical protein